MKRGLSMQAAESSTQLFKTMTEFHRSACACHADVVPHTRGLAPQMRLGAHVQHSTMRAK
jgi:hypothetical protein